MKPILAIAVAIVAMAPIPYTGETYVLDEPPPPVVVEKSTEEMLSQYDWDYDIAYAVMMAESNGNPDAINWEDYHPTCECYGSFGLFQLASFWGEEEELLDPETNIKMAYEIYSEQGWRPWSAYLNKSYLAFYD